MMAAAAPAPLPGFKGYANAWLAELRAQQAALRASELPAPPALPPPGAPAPPCAPGLLAEAAALAGAGGGLPAAPLAELAAGAPRGRAERAANRQAAAAARQAMEPSLADLPRSGAPAPRAPSLHETATQHVAAFSDAGRAPAGALDEPVLPELRHAALLLLPAADSCTDAAAAALAAKHPHLQAATMLCLGSGGLAALLVPLHGDEPPAGACDALFTRVEGPLPAEPGTPGTPRAAPPSVDSLLRRWAEQQAAAALPCEPARSPPLAGEAGGAAAAAVAASQPTTPQPGVPGSAAGGRASWRAVRLALEEVALPPCEGRTPSQLRLLPGADGKQAQRPPTPFEQLARFVAAQAADALPAPCGASILSLLGTAVPGGRDAAPRGASAASLLLAPPASLQEADGPARPDGCTAAAAGVTMTGVLAAAMAAATGPPRSAPAVRVEAAVACAPQERAAPAAAAADGGPQQSGDEAAPAGSPGALRSPSLAPCAADLLPAAELMVEVPVCLLDDGGPGLVDGALEAALATAQALLEAETVLAPGDGGSPRGGERAPACWDASWGDLPCDDGSGSPWWASCAVRDAFGGAASPRGSQAAAAPDGAGGGGAALGVALLEGLLAREMQPDDASGLLLPVPPFPGGGGGGLGADALGLSFGAGGGSFFRELASGCAGYQREPTAHLELYCDWSVLQPLQAPSGGSGAGGPDTAAWLRLCEGRPGLRVLSELLAAPASRGGAPGGRELAQAASVRVLQAALAAGAAPGRAAGGAEAVPPGVAAAAAAWRREQAAAALLGGPAAPAAAAGAAAPNGAPPAAGPAAQSDLDFFVQLHHAAGSAPGGSGRAAKRRASAQQGAEPADEAAPGNGAPKRARGADSAGGGGAGAAGAGGGAAEEASEARQHATAELAVTGAVRAGGAAGGPAAPAGHRQERDPGAAAASAGPHVITAALPAPLLALLLRLQANRRALLRAMRAPGPSLTGCCLWDAGPVQAAVDAWHAAAAAAPLGPEDKGQARLVVGLLLLAQAAGCLLHHGVRVAHLFLSHSLARLPSLAEACAEGAAALSAAYARVERGGPRAGALADGDGAAVGAAAAAEDEDHPRLDQLRQLLRRLEAAKPGCTVLLVAEARAVFTLLTPLASAGFPAAQLDRGRALLADGGGAGAPAWRAAAATALAGARCVLATPAHLAHACMPLEGFDVLVECDGGGGPGEPGSNEAASATAPGRAAEHFAGRHYVLRTAPPDLGAAACGAAPAPAAAPEPARKPGLGAALEARGFALVERALRGGGAGGGGGGAPGGCVDVVLSPAACLCVWDAAKLPQEPGAAADALAREVLALSLAYEQLVFVLELPDALLQPLVGAAPALHGLARRGGVRLQLLCSFTAAGTQDMVLSICAATAAAFWAGPGDGDGASPRPPGGLSDLPSAAEAFWGACAAANPLSAAQLAAAPAPLRAVVDAVAAGGAAALAPGLPEHSARLLAAQLSANHMRLEPSPPPPSARKRPRGAWEHGGGEQGGAWALDEEQQGGAWALEAQQLEQERQRQQQEQEHAWALQQHQLEGAAHQGCYGGAAEAAGGWYGHTRDAPAGEAWATELERSPGGAGGGGEQPGWLEPAAGPQPGRWQHAYEEEQPRQRARHAGAWAQAGGGPCAEARWPSGGDATAGRGRHGADLGGGGGIDPGGVLDAFLSSRQPAGAGWRGSAGGQQPQRARGQAGAAEGPARGGGSGEGWGGRPRPRAPGRAWPAAGDGDGFGGWDAEEGNEALPDIALPFDLDVSTDADADAPPPRRGGGRLPRRQPQLQHWQWQGDDGEAEAGAAWPRGAGAAAGGGIGRGRAQGLAGAGKARRPLAGLLGSRVAGGGGGGGRPGVRARNMFSAGDDDEDHGGGGGGADGSRGGDADGSVATGASRLTLQAKLCWG
ncbi:hypothetical protein HT031_004140 [Scenedesmus sp. PABB004]|nr:hypothetical protein HT031_004140 [Scenedesmus sp. PABB004]